MLRDCVEYFFKLGEIFLKDCMDVQWFCAQDVNGFNHEAPTLNHWNAKPPNLCMKSAYQRGRRTAGPSGLRPAVQITRDCLAGFWLPRLAWRGPDDQFTVMLAALMILAKRLVSSSICLTISSRELPTASAPILLIRSRKSGE